MASEIFYHNDIPVNKLGLYLALCIYGLESWSGVLKWVLGVEP